MLTPADIAHKANAHYHAFLQATLAGASLFPLEIRFGKIPRSADHATRRAIMCPLMEGSKARLGYGYTVEMTLQQTRRYGPQSAPSRIFIETEADYLKLLGKEQEVATFRAAVTLPNSFALFGGGRKVELLKQIAWLKPCPIVYWGDLDTHGFSSLAQVRSSFPQTTALMMDRATFDAFAQFQVPAEPYTGPCPPELTPEEQALFAYLAAETTMLEQEHITHAYAVQQLQRLAPK